LETRIQIGPAAETEIDRFIRRNGATEIVERGTLDTCRLRWRRAAQWGAEHHRTTAAGRHPRQDAVVRHRRHLSRLTTVADRPHSRRANDASLLGHRSIKCKQHRLTFDSNGLQALRLLWNNGMPASSGKAAGGNIEGG